MKIILPIILFVLISVNLLADEYKVGDHELMLMPTAFTMPKGKSYFSDYELVFLNLVHAPTNRMHLGFFTLFPITSTMLESFTVGIKQNYFKSGNVNLALWGTYTPRISGATLGNVLSFGKPDKSIHLGLSFFGDVSKDLDPEFVYMVGARYKKLIIEYTNVKTWADNDFDGIFTIGFRFGGDNICFEIGGFRPVQDLDINIFLLPLLKGTVLF
ncbi:MAG: hypothetical protein H8E57_05860 [Candidatus Cloacimonetes bacterium]|nr:hypothetical protein [Candidatus Cloacimonadota bacterium]